MSPSRDKALAYRIRTRCERNLRDRLLSLYGGKCAICGYAGRDALQLDHINGDGAREREELGSTKQVYARALRAYRPDRYRILCANCNLEERERKGHFGGRHNRREESRQDDGDFGPLFQEEKAPPKDGGNTEATP